MPVVFDNTPAPTGGVVFDDDPRDTPIQTEKPSLGKSFVKAYNKSIESSFQSPLTGRIPKIDTETPIGKLVAGLAGAGMHVPPEVAAGILNSASGAAEAIPSPGGLSLMVNPLAKLYAAPYFAGQAVTSAQQIPKSVGLQDLTENVISTVMNSVGAVVLGLEGAKPSARLVSEGNAPKPQPLPKPKANPQIMATVDAAKADAPIGQANAQANSIAAPQRPLEAIPSPSTALYPALDTQTTPGTTKPLQVAEIGQGMDKAKRVKLTNEAAIEAEAEAQAKAAKGSVVFDEPSTPKENAIPKQSPAEVPLLNPPGDGKKVGENDLGHQQSAGTQEPTNAAREAKLNEEVGQVAQALQEGPSQKMEPRELKSSRGVDLGFVDRISEKIANTITKASNSAEGLFDKTVNIDTNLDILGGSTGHNSPISQVIGGGLGHSHNAMENLKAEWKQPIKDAIRGKDLTKTQMERVDIYAIDRMDAANPDIPNTHLKDSLSPREVEVLRDIRKNGLTPEEQSYYDAVRKVYDDKIFPEVSKLMKDEYGINLKKVNDYWALQRDYSKFKSKPAEVSEPFHPGEEAGLDEAVRAITSDFNQPLTSKTPQGATIERVVNAGGPVKIGENAVERHIDRMAHLVAQTHTLRVLGKVARQDSFAAKYGNGGQKMVLDLIDSVARQGDPKGAYRNKTVEAAARNISVGILAFRVLSQAKHASNLAIAAREVGPARLYKGLVDSVTEDGESFVKKNAREIYNRKTGGEQAIADMLSGGKFGKFQAATFIFERFIDYKLATGSYLASYLKHMQERGYTPDNYLDAPINHEANRLALVDARKVVTSTLVKDSPQAISRGLMNNNITAARLMFQFQQTMLKNAAYAKHEIFDLGIKKKEYGKALSAATTMGLVLATASGLTVLNKELMSAITGKKDKDKDNLAMKEVKDIGHEAVRQTPVIGPTISALTTHGQSGVPLVDTVTGAGSRLGELLADKNSHGGKLSKNESARLRIELATTAGSLAGIPGISTVGQLVEDKYYPPKKKP